MVITSDMVAEVLALAVAILGVHRAHVALDREAFRVAALPYRDQILGVEAVSCPAVGAHAVPEMVEDPEMVVGHLCREGVVGVHVDELGIDREGAGDRPVVWDL